MDLNQIIKDLWPEVFRFVYYKVQNKEEAEEITQDTFEKVSQKLADDKVDRDKIKSYSLSAANNRIIDIWRKKGRRPKETSMEDNYIYTIGVPDKQKEIEDKLMVRKAMEQLRNNPGRFYYGGL
ncbi:MAG: RNA polymerase sigma factor [Bacillota bacterium]